MRSASAGVRSSGSVAKSFSVPLWAKPSRVSRFTIVSPWTLNRKWPGSMIPARTGGEHGSGRRERDGREGIDEREVARARARVRRGEELAGRAELREPVRQRGNLAGRHTALERVGGARRHAGRPRLDDGPRER